MYFFCFISCGFYYCITVNVVNSGQAFSIYSFFYLKAAKLSSLSVEENSKSFVLYQLPSRYSNHCNDLPQVDVTDLLFSVDKPIVLHSLNLFGEPEKDYKFTAFVAKVCVCVCVCVSVCKLTVFVA